MGFIQFLPGLQQVVGDAQSHKDQQLVSAVVSPAAFQSLRRCFKNFHGLFDKSRVRIGLVPDVYA